MKGNRTKAKLRSRVFYNMSVEELKDRLDELSILKQKAKLNTARKISPYGKKTVSGRINVKLVQYETALILTKLKNEGMH